MNKVEICCKEKNMFFKINVGLKKSIEFLQYHALKHFEMEF